MEVAANPGDGAVCAATSDIGELGCLLEGFRAIADSVSKHHCQDFASWGEEADGSKLFGETRDTLGRRQTWTLRQSSCSLQVEVLWCTLWLAKGRPVRTTEGVPYSSRHPRVRAEVSSSRVNASPHRGSGGSIWETRSPNIVRKWCCMAFSSFNG